MLNKVNIFLLNHNLKWQINYDHLGNLWENPTDLFSLGIICWNLHFLIKNHDGVLMKGFFMSSLATVSVGFFYVQWNRRIPIDSL